MFGYWLKLTAKELVLISCIQLWLIVTSTRFAWELRDQTGQQHSAVEYIRVSDDVLSVEAVEPHVVPTSFWMMVHLVFSFA